MYAEIAVNVEVPVAGTYHYHVPPDLQPKLQVGHLVEVEFGSRLAQGILVKFAEEAPVPDTKPILAVIAEEPVVWPWQIQLAQWISHHNLAPLNACLRLMLPPGLSRHSDVTVDINPHWDGSGRLTQLQEELVELLRERGDLRGRQIRRAMPGKAWKETINQLARRDIVRKASVLDPPRVRPKTIRTVELIAGPARIFAAIPQLGRNSKQAEVLYFLAQLMDPLPSADSVLQATGANAKHLRAMAGTGLITYIPAGRLQVSLGSAADPVDATVEQQATVSLAIPLAEVPRHVMRLRGAEAYDRILRYLAKEAQPVALSDVYASAGAKLNQLRKLSKLDLVRFGAEEVWRDPLADRDFTPSDPPLLTADQARVWGRVKVAMIHAEEASNEATAKGVANAIAGLGNGPADSSRSQLPFLLNGVTGSGKTEIYMRAIEFALHRQQRAIVLVPEISLTPQTVRRFAARFPGRVAILHSRLSDGERYDTWRRARQGLIDIVIGPRSALFTPLPNLGVIVIDEEHDASYKQDPPVPAPYYHARDVAIAAGRLLGATVILGSATPDLVSFHRAQAGRYRLLELPRRVMGHRRRIESQAERLRVASHYQQDGSDPDEALTIPLPPVQVVDLRQELRAGNRSIFSRALEQAVTETLERREQAILFLNRRGSASFVFCRDCGYVQACPRCDLPLTFHRRESALICHHCGRQQAQALLCPQCGSERIRYFALGTEEVERRLQERWPQARITRWDRDTTAGKYSHEQLLASFINQEADILIGTQMIAKGLDLPLVTLVGVISADVALGLPDYRSGERAFQLLAQVAGRAGRGLLGGRVILQTYQPGHYAIQAAADHDFTSFYLEEIRFRTRHGLPPFRRLVRLLLVDPVNERGRREAGQLAKALRNHIREKQLGGTEMLGPVPPYFNRVDGRYRWQIILRTPDPARLLSDFVLPAPWLLDIDPVSTL